MGRPDPIALHQRSAREPLDLAPVRALLDRIVEALDPSQVWLFGSRARGEAREGSDWDLLVVLPDGTDDARADTVALWRLQRDQSARADLVACHERDFDEDRTTPNTLAYEAWNHGVLLYSQPPMTAAR